MPLSTETAVSHRREDVVPCLGRTATISAVKVAAGINPQHQHRLGNSRLVVSIGRRNGCGKCVVDRCSSPCEHDIGPQVAGNALDTHWRGIRSEPLQHQFPYTRRRRLLNDTQGLLHIIAEQRAKVLKSGAVGRMS